ncbi:MAG: SpoIIE family protein phosphatase [Pyrinomonadaceae bacterium MAG19_C2-C3]|nr:SpoIIE family protein phosphatase [Pyrinomonadaceae bacterium MAG19_C2-C3]
MRFIEHLTARASLIQRIVFWLAPLACLLGIWFTLRHDPNTKIDLRLDRSAAIERAREYAAGRGVDVSTWTSGCRAEANNDRYSYFRIHENADTGVLRRLTPEVFINVMFANYETGEVFAVTLAPDGAPVGFRHNLSDANSQTAGGAVTFNVDELTHAVAPSATLEVSRAAADAELTRIAGEYGIPLNSFSTPVLKETRTPKIDEVTRHFTYRLNLPESSEVEVNQLISVVGNKIIQSKATTKVDKAYAKANFLNHQILNTIALSFYGVLLAVLVIYGLYRYLQLTRQKEVPHARSLLIAAVVGLIFFLIAMQTDFVIIAPGTPSRIAFWMTLVLGGGFVTLFMGLGIGIVFGAGEGTVREAYPGKLTSFDALLTGRIFSRNVARSVLVGVALGSWLVLLQSLPTLFWLGRADGGLGLASNLFEIFYGRLTPLLPLLNPPLHSVMVVISGLLLPLALFHRRIRADRRYFAVLILLCIVANFGTVQTQPMPFLALVMQSTALALVLLASFFFYDLLTAIVAAGVPALVTFVTYLAVQPSTSLRQAAWVSVGIVIVILLIEIYLMARGRTYTEDDVRPLYARHLAERVRMQSEVSAAREAQVRLMPAVLPQLANLSIAAECRPARTVGGDFFDVFSLDEKRIGVFVAEGGERGLEAALTIAFAKGFLMPRLQSGDTPGEIVCSLQTRLSPLLDLNQSALGLTFAVFDTGAGTFTYARTGDYPRVVIRRTNGDIISGDTERIWNLDTASPDSSSDCSIREAQFTFEAGDAAVIITDGIAKTLTTDAGLAKLATDITRLDRKSNGKQLTVSGANLPAQDLSLKPVARDDIPLRHALAAALKVQAKRARKLGIEDDLTAVVLRYDFASLPA